MIDVCGFPSPLLDACQIRTKWIRHCDVWWRALLEANVPAGAVPAGAVPAGAVPHAEQQEYVCECDSEEYVDVERELHGCVIAL